MSHLQKELINQSEEIETIDLSEVRCSRCNRILKSDKSIARGMGEICSKKDAYEKYQASHPPKEAYLTSNQEKDILQFVKNYSQPKTSLLETTNDQFNYIWGLARGSSWYKGNTSFYTKYEIKKINALLKISI